MQVQVHITAGRQIKDSLASKLRDLKLGIAGVFMSEAQAFRSQAQARAPSDTGKLRSMIKMRKPRAAGDKTDRRYTWIGASVSYPRNYGVFVEYGTIRGSIIQDKNPVELSRRERRNQQRRQSWSRRGARKLPPIVHGSGLAAWAERKGINRWALQRAIGGRMKGRKGGSKAHPFWMPVALSEPARINPIMLAMARRVFA